MHSCIYTGSLRHRRFHEVDHQLNYNIAYFLVDLDEVEQVFNIPLLFNSKFPSLFRFDRNVMMAPVDRPLKTVALDACEKLLGMRPTGNVRVLTQLSSFGFGFNPVSFYYFYNLGEEKCCAVLAEITNTPWGERYTYGQNTLTAHHKKVFHVSPYLGMAYQYHWSFSNPGHTLTVHMENMPEIENAKSTKHFDATLSLTRHEINRSNLFFTLIQFPFMTLKTLLAIYIHAGILWCKSATFFPHPQKGQK